MAKRPSVRFVCTNCGAIISAWAGRCPQCGEWNTLQEETELSVPSLGGFGGSGSFGGGSGSRVSGSGRPLAEESVEKVAATEQTRISTDIPDADMVLGGGFVAGSVVLLAGQPGIGKSTLLLQVAHNIARQHQVLYVSAEESARQIGLRATRLGKDQGGLKIATSTSADDIAATVMQGDHDLVIVDSIQTVACAAVASAPGTVSQITNSTALLMQAAKHSNTALIIVGHVTKEGGIAGPKVLEHLVDVVVQLEGDRYGGFKMLRAIKNRFGSTSETGIFEMIETGLRPVENPSAALLAERQISDGSVVLATIEGTRPILVEVQALVNRTNYGYPKRTASGIDLNRLNLLIAVLERRTKPQLADQDVYINIVGGMKITEPAADLAICMAIASAAKGMQLPENIVVFGEVGLSGEVRHVPFIEKRLSEADKLGFTAALGPKIRSGKTPRMLRSVADVRTALNTYLVREP